MTDQLVHAVVVAYGNSDELDLCLSTLDQSAPVTVVDNSSSDQVREVAARHGAVYIDAGRNLGFAAGVNLALRALSTKPPRSVLLLNPDASLPPTQLNALRDHLFAIGREDVAAVSPRLIDHDGTAQRVEWPFPTPWRSWLDALGLGRWAAGDSFVVGAVALLRWDAIHEVGYFDERFFLYSEETDWMRRATNGGWRCEVADEAVANHRGAGSSSDPLRREALFHAGQETYIRKWHGLLGWEVYRCAAAVGAMMRAILLNEPRRSEARRRASLYLRGPRRCAGLTADRVGG